MDQMVDCHGSMCILFASWHLPMADLETPHENLYRMWTKLVLAHCYRLGIRISEFYSHKEGRISIIEDLSSLKLEIMYLKWMTN